jgi:hypothetical protein
MMGMITEVRASSLNRHGNRHTIWHQVSQNQLYDACFGGIFTPTKPANKPVYIRLWTLHRWNR